jgi:hypothetical protein
MCKNMLKADKGSNQCWYFKLNATFKDKLHFQLNLMVYQGFQTEQGFKGVPQISVTSDLK